MVVVASTYSLLEVQVRITDQPRQRGGLLHLMMRSSHAGGTERTQIWVWCGCWLVHACFLAPSQHLLTGVDLWQVPLGDV